MHLLQFIMTMLFMSLLSACAMTERTVHQEDRAPWIGITVNALETHTLFSTMPMFRTNTDSGTEIRNYAYGYDFGECFGKAGASKPGDYVNTHAFIKCSSSQIVCNHFFYIKEEKVLEYAPTGRCNMDKRTQPKTRHAQTNN